MVSSRQWPLISRYRAAVRTQSPKVEMIDSLYKRISDTEDDGIMRSGILSLSHLGAGFFFLNSSSFPFLILTMWLNFLVCNIC